MPRGESKLPQYMDLVDKEIGCGIMAMEHRQVQCKGQIISNITWVVRLIYEREEEISNYKHARLCP